MKTILYKSPENVKWLTGYALLKSFIKEHFHFNTLLKAGFFTKEMRGDYKAQAERICKWFGYQTVYEYASKEIVCHITENNPTKFVTVIPSIYE